MTVDQIIDATIGKEGHYSDNPNDRGGPTCYGVTEAVARQNGYLLDMRTMPRATAVAIYKTQYYAKPGFALVAAVSPRIAEELFDTGVNMGPSVPSLWFQQWLNALNNGGSDYADIKEDGAIGPATVAALGRLIAKRGKTEAEHVMLLGLNCSQGARYLELARGRIANEAFVFGWLAGRVGL